MKIVKWIPQVLLIIAFVLAGLMKMFTPHETIVGEMGIAWAADVNPWLIKLLGFLEFAGALGLFLPILLKKYQFLVPIAAICLGLVMILAMPVHINLGEPIIPNLVLLACNVAVVWLRRDLLKGVRA